jgi:nucleoside-diphosphate-sugar epimerase
MTGDIAMDGRVGVPCAPGEADRFLSEPPGAVVEMVRRVPGDFAVLGAAGKMGLHVCMMLRRALDEAGGRRRVLAVSRFGKPEARGEFEERGIGAVACDLCEPDQLENLPDVPNVIFMAGAKFGTAGNPGLLKRMNKEMPSLVADRFSGSRITAFSTGCVYAFEPVDTAGSTENSATDPVGAYAQSCLGREMAFRRVAQNLGTRVALIRLNYSVEFRYGVPVDIARKILAGEAVDVTMGCVNLIWQRDAVAHSLLAHELASHAPFVLNVTGSGTHRVRELAVRLGELLGREPVIAGEEADTAWISDASLSHRLFGQPEVSLGTMLAWIAAWQLAGLPTFNKPTGFEKRDGNF